jgi:hypothetical protein
MSVWISLSAERSMSLACILIPSGRRLACIPSDGETPRRDPHANLREYRIANGRNKDQSSVRVVHHFRKGWHAEISCDIGSARLLDLSFRDFPDRTIASPRDNQSLFGL